MIKKIDERHLAQKIAWLSMLIILALLWLIISTSYFYQRSMNIRSFLTEVNSIDPISFLTNELSRDRVFFENIIWPRERGKKWPRNFIIIDKNWNVVSDSFWWPSKMDVTRILTNSWIREKDIEIDWHTYLIARKNLPEYTLLFFYDLTPLQDFHIQLMIVAAAWSIFALFLIYFLSYSLAKVTIQPIKEHNEYLMTYSHNVAHELRTPLAVMRSDLEILSLKHPEQNNESLVEEIENMQNIIDGLLFLADPDKKGDWKTGEITKVVQNVLGRFEKNEISFQNSLSQERQVNIHLFERLMVNLLENAIKYGNWNIVLSLSDTKIVISNSVEKNLKERDLKHLTEAFYQWDSSRHTKWYWLWLSLVQKIVDIFEWDMRITCKNHIFSVILSFEK